MKSSVDFNTATDSRFTLWYAARRGNMDRIKTLLQRNPDIINNPEPQSGATALQIASRGGHVEIVAHLLEKLADPNLKDPEGNTSLHLAAGKIDTATFYSYVLRCAYVQRGEI